MIHERVLWRTFEIMVIYFWLLASIEGVNFHQIMCWCPLGADWNQHKTQLLSRPDVSVLFTHQLHWWQAVLSFSLCHLHSPIQPLFLAKGGFALVRKKYFPEALKGEILIVSTKLEHLSTRLRLVYFVATTYFC